ncbi:MauE/DoxX family redox-associated membrane protein [Streptomyces sp. NPDC048636]|uniref:MauE/DoxX family redox-associated membrane protein n=1 Tax=Streptomyces sp. NPDC048636 TaxID=3155762 RepID=UPI003436B857
MGDSMGYALLACRFLIGGVFVVSAVSKLRGRAAFREFETAAQEMGAPVRFRRPVALAVVAAEGLIPLLLVVPPGGLAGLALGGAMLIVFTVAMANALRRKKTTSCACFGSSTAPIGRQHVVRNVALLAVAGTGVAAVLGGAPEFPSHAGGIAVAAFAALVGVLLVIATDELAAVFAAHVPHQEN